MAENPRAGIPEEDLQASKPFPWSLSEHLMERSHADFEIFKCVVL